MIFFRRYLYGDYDAIAPSGSPSGGESNAKGQLSGGDVIKANTLQGGPSAGVTPPPGEPEGAVLTVCKTNLLMYTPAT